MAYTGATLSMLNRNIEGGLREWLYISTDSLATMTAASYISDATNRGIQKGDIVWAVNQSTPTVYVLQVSSVAAGTLASPGAATLIGESEATSVVSFFGVTPVTTQPAATAQSAVATTAITAVPTTAVTTAITTAVTGTFGFVTQAQGDAIVAAVNSLIARVALNVTAVNSLITQSAADVVLANQIRTDLVSLGLIKGSA